MLVGRRDKKTGMSYLRIKAVRVTCIFDSNSKGRSFLSNGCRWELSRRPKLDLLGGEVAVPIPGDPVGTTDLASEMDREGAFHCLPRKDAQ